MRKVGFKLNHGIRDTGLLLLLKEKGGGHYFGKSVKVACHAKARIDISRDADTGASQLIIDGKIKLKTSTEIESFTEQGLKFADGTELPADLVVFATG